MWSQAVGTGWISEGMEGIVGENEHIRPVWQSVTRIEVQLKLPYLETELTELAQTQNADKDSINGLILEGVDLMQ